MIIAIDTETGGTHPGRSALLSISACHVDNPATSFTVFLLPADGDEIHPSAAAVNGYTPELWAERGAVPLLEGLKRFKAWLPYRGNSPLAHNASFDDDMIQAAEEKVGFKLYLQKRWRCSMALSMGLNDALGLNLPDFRLDTLARLCGHWAADYERGSHQSIDDVRACAAIWTWGIEMIRKGGLK